MKLITTIILILCSFASAQQIASIDMESTFLNFHKTIRFEIKMQEQKSIIEKHGAELKKKYDDEIIVYKKLQAEAGNPSLPKAQRMEKSREATSQKSDIMNLKKDMKSFMIDADELMKKQYDESRKTILSEIQTIVEMIAKKNNYDVVIDKSGKTSNLIPLFVGSEKTADITVQTINVLNIGQEKFIREWKADNKEKATKEINP